jgi:hypothetical protein
LLAFEDGNNKRVIQKNVGQKNKSVVRQVFIFLSHIFLYDLFPQETISIPHAQGESASGS